MKKFTAAEQILVQQTAGELIKEVESDPSILQAHGSAFYISLPDGHQGQVQIIITKDTNSFIDDSVTILTLKKL